MAYPPSTTDRTNGQTIDASHINVINDAVDDIVAELGTNPSGGSATVDARITAVEALTATEWVQDIVGAMVTGNTETGITVTYQDSDGTLDFAVSGGGGSGVGAMQVTVAASNSPTAIQDRADYVCTGTDDQTTINNILGTGPSPVATWELDTYRNISIQFADGDYSLSGPILIPNRGIELRGSSKLTRFFKQSGTFTNAGQGSLSALFKTSTAAEGYSSALVSIRNMSLDCNSASISGIVIDLDGATPDNDNSPYGEPATSPDAYNTFADLYIYDCDYGIYIAGASGKPRNNFIHNNSIRGVAIAGISGSGSSDNVISNNMVQTGSASGAIGIQTPGGSSVIVNNKCAYFPLTSGTAGTGYKLSSSRAFLSGNESQDNNVGYDITSQDCVITGCKVDTQVNPCDVGFMARVGSGGFLQLVGCSVFTRDTGTLTHGIRFRHNGLVQATALIDPTGITAPVCVYNGSGTDTLAASYTEVTSVSQLPFGDYSVHVAGVRTISSNVGPAKIVVAASDAPSTQLQRADVYCDGTSDEVQINAAFKLIGALSNQYGSVELTAGSFNTLAPILIPSRGCSLRGAGMNTRIKASTSFVDGGSGTGTALIKLGTAAEAYNATGVQISDMHLDANSKSVAGIYFDQTSATAMNAASNVTYGEPTTYSNSDSYHRFTDLLITNCTYGVRLVATGSNYIGNVRVYNVATTGFSTASCQDNHFDACYVANDTGSGTTYGFDIGTSSQLSYLSNCEVRDFQNTGAVGFNIQSARCRLMGCSVRDTVTGYTMTGAEGQMTGCRYETSAFNATMGVNLVGNRQLVTGLHIATPSTATLATALNIATDTHNHNVTGVTIYPSGTISKTVSVASGTEVTTSSALPTGSTSLGVYSIYIQSTRYLEKTATPA